MAWHEGDLVHKLRSMCGWNVKELAKRARMNPSVIYRLEDGRTKNPTKPTIEKLAAVFGFDDRDFRNAIPRGVVMVPIDPGKRVTPQGERHEPAKTRRQVG